MGLIPLTIYPRLTTGKNANRRTRAGGRIPAVVYGARDKVANVELDAAEFQKALAGHGGGGIFALNEAEGGRSAIGLLREVQRHPVRDIVYHVDIFEIPTDRPISIQVPVVLQGESLDVKRGDASIVWATHTVAINCLPSELPESVVVDVSGLKTGDKVHISDLRTTAGELADDPEDLVFQLQAAALFVEPTAPAAAEGEAAATEGEAAEGAAEKAGEGAEGKDKGKAEGKPEGKDKGKPEGKDKGKDKK